MEGFSTTAKALGLDDLWSSERPQGTVRPLVKAWGFFVGLGYAECLFHDYEER